MTSFYETLLEAVGDAVIALDPQGCIVVWNAAAAALYGWTREEVVGRPMVDFLVTTFDDPEESLERIVSSISATNLWRGVCRQARKDGQEVVVESTVRSYQGRDAGPSGVVAINRDIGEQEKLRRAISRLEYLNRVLLRLPTIERIFQTYIEQIRQVIAFDRAEIWLLNPDTASVQAVQCYTRDGSAPADRPPAALKYTPLGLVHFTKQTLIIDDLEQKNLLAQNRHLLLPGDRSMMLMPLLRSQEVVGGILFASAAPRHFHPDDAQLLALTTEQVSLALIQIQLTESLKEQAAENARLYHEAQGHARQLQGLSHMLMQSQERERERLSREFHDEIGQALTAVYLNLSSALAPDGQLTLSGAEGLSDSVEIVSRLMDQVRSISLDLHPKILDDLGFVPALRWLVNRTARLAQAEVKLDLPAVYLPLPKEIEFELFRVTQEALTNVLRHARAAHLWISLEQAQRCTRLRVADDGAGFDAEYTGSAQLPAEACGLQSMFARAEFLNAALHIASRPGQGTVVTIEYEHNR
ncbi:MAG: PAS domain S-box protein [Chloroflexota bacterium]